MEKRRDSDDVVIVDRQTEKQLEALVGREAVEQIKQEIREKQKEQKNINADILEIETEKS